MQWRAGRFLHPGRESSELASLVYPPRVDGLPDVALDEVGTAFDEIESILRDYFSERFGSIDQLGAKLLYFYL